MLDLDALGLLAREVLRERAPVLIADACAWSVGLSDTAHYEQRDGRVIPSGLTLFDRAESEQSLASETAGRLDLEGARPGTFQDALNALTREGSVHADRFDDEVLAPYAMDTAVEVLERLRETAPDDWQELLEEVGEDGRDASAVVRALEWEAPLRTVAEELVLAALGDVPLLEVEREGAPLAVVRAAERLTAGAVRSDAEDEVAPDEGVMFLAEAAIDRVGLPTPVPPERARHLLVALLQEGLEPDEVRQALPHLPVLADTADRVTDLLDLHE